MSGFRLYSDKKYRYRNSIGLFTANSASHTLAECEASYKAGEFTELKDSETGEPMVTKKGEPVFGLSNILEEGNDLSSIKKVSVRKAAADEQLDKVTINWIEV
jgi:hypothetical protein